MKAWEDILPAYGFEPWQYGDMRGWHRRTDFVKSCVVGEIGRYGADDYIVTKHNGRVSEKFLREHWQSRSDTITHRFLFVDSAFSQLSIKSYWFGIKGWLEILHYRKGDEEKKFQDLIYLAEMRYPKE